MGPADVSGCARTSTLLSALPVQTPTNPFWSVCATPLYTSTQCPSIQPQSVTNAAALREVASSTNSVPSSFASTCMQTQPVLSARPSRRQELKGLPCPMLYQAKEPEAISDVLRRAGKKALGGGIPGECCVIVEDTALSLLSFIGCQ